MPLPDNFPVLVFAVLVIFLAGAVVFYAVVRDPLRFSRLERFAYCYPLGMAALAMPMFLASWAGYHIRVLPVLLAIVAGASIAYAIRRIPPAILWKRNPDAPRIQPFTEFEWCLIVLIVGCLLVRTMTSLVIPLNDGDGHAVWCFKAKIFFFDTIRTTDYFSRHELNYSNISYPLLVPFMYTWVATVAGHWDDMGIFILNPTNLVVFAILLYCTVRKFAARTVALAVTAMLSSLPALMHYAECGQGDVPLMLIGGASLFCLFDWMQNRRVDSIVLAAILMGGALFTKQDGQILLVAHLLAAGMTAIFMTQSDKRKRSFAHLALYLGIALSMFLPWFAFRFGIPKEAWVFDGKSLGSVRWDEIPNLMRALASNAFKFYNGVGLPKWNILWPIILISLVVGRAPRERPWNLLLLIFLLHSAAINLVLLKTQSNLTTGGGIEFGFERQSLTMLPPLWMLLARCLNEFWLRWKTSEQQGL